MKQRIGYESPEVSVSVMNFRTTICISLGEIPYEITVDEVNTKDLEYIIQDDL